ncbi:MAG: polyphenol oxidase family protein [Candidatus Peregrinibacteria bacterium]
MDFFQIFEPFGNSIQQGFTNREWGGNFKKDQPEFAPSVARLMKELNIPEPVTGNQVHGDVILTLEKKPHERPTCDAFITRVPNLPLMVKVADCQGVLMYDPKTRTIAAGHSGWRGSALNIIGKTIAKLTRMGSDPADLLVAISPSIGPCCSEFTDPFRELPPTLHPYIYGKHVDFWAASIAQSLDAGIQKGHIEGADQCTRCHPNLYYSHRRGDLGRMAVFIALK